MPLSFHRYTLTITHIAVDLNKMADDASHLWHLSNNAILYHFNYTYPQHLSWKLSVLRLDMNSVLISALSKKKSLPASFLPVERPTQMCGRSGLSSIGPSVSTPSSEGIVTPPPSYRYFPAYFAPVDSPSTEATYAHVLQSRTSGWLARRSPDWASATRG
uniref:Uncharacterized protein n=1 Tax=Odontella aurita TaxID=265563 RepID=A0A7S4NIL8_9STRA